MRDRQPPSPASHGATLRDAEEFSDLYFHRPIARPVVTLLLATPITPNQVTVASGAAGVLAAVVLANSLGRPWLRVAAAVLLLASTILDCCDGQLARAKNMMSPNGIMLDAATDVVVGLAMVVAVADAAARFTGSPRPWLLAAVALVSYALQCFLFDAVKEQFFTAHGLRYSSGKGEYVDKRRAGKSSKRSWLFDQYWRAAGAFIRPAGTARPAIGRTAMRVWTTLGQGTHMTCLYLAAAASALWPPALSVCLLVFAVAMNVVLVGLFVAG